jgi:sugar/nucleoside kinase (ribokinase family)
MYEQHIHLDEYENSNDSLVKSVKFKVGGSAFNTANGLAEMGHKVNLITSIGTDLEGEYLKEILKNIKNINTDFVDFSNSESSKVFALINNLKEHKFLSFRCNYIYLKNILEKFKINKNDFLHISGYSFQDSNSKIIGNELIDICRTNSGILSIDPSLNYAKNFNRIERDYCIDYFFPNQEEASIISGVSNFEESAKILHAKKINNIIITLGNNGCYFSNSFHRKLYKPHSICDHSLTIGAGDSFVAGFLSAKINHLSVEECVQSANKSAFDYLTNSNYE